MKTTRIRSILVVTVVSILMLTVTAALSRHAAAVQSAAIACGQPAPVLPSTAYSDLLNGLAIGGR